MLGRKERPKSIDSEHVHEVLFLCLREDHGVANDTRVREHHVQPPVTTERIVHDLLDRLLVRGIKLPRVDFHGGVQGLDLPLVVTEVLVSKVTEVDCLCAVLGELMGRGPPYSQGRVYTWGLGSRVSEMTASSDTPWPLRRLSKVNR